ncbi:hypothetical protein JCM10213v2_008285 [Rhodosporidiobolus nylandii]
MASIIVTAPPDSPRDSTSTHPSDHLSTSPLHAASDTGASGGHVGALQTQKGGLAVPSPARLAVHGQNEPSCEAGGVVEGGLRGGRHRAGSAASATSTDDTTLLHPDHPPPLNFHFTLRGPLLYLAFLVLCNVVIPCMLYYPLKDNTDLSDESLIGIGSAVLGLSSCFDAPFRMYKLTRHRAKYGPLYYPYAPDPAHQPAGNNRLMKNMPRSWWHLGANFFLFSFAMLIAPVGIIFALSLKSWHNLPFWCSSDPPRTSTKPACYYFVEDIGAVDFGHGREWRKRCQARYAASPPFRALMWSQTLFWTVASVIFVGLTAVVDWVSSLNVAFGVVISLIFMWAIVFGIISYIMVHFALKKELAWWRAEYAGLVAEHHAPRGATPQLRAAMLAPPPTDERQNGESESEFLGEKGLSKPGKVAQGRHRGWSIHAKLAPTPAQSLRGTPTPETGNGERQGSPEMVQVRDGGGRAAAGSGQGEASATLARSESPATTLGGMDFGSENEKQGTNGSPV